MKLLASGLVLFLMALFGGSYFMTVITGWLQFPIFTCFMLEGYVGVMLIAAGLVNIKGN